MVIAGRLETIEASSVTMTKAARKPRYIEIADYLRAAILRGDYPNPAQFPTESALCTQFGISRFTVREALRALQNEGLIQRRRGSGTTIRPAAARGGALHQPLSNVGEILQYAHDTAYRFTKHGLVAISDKTAALMGVERGSRWFHMRGVRTRAGDPKPIAYTEAYIHRDLSNAAEAIDTSETTIFRALERLAGIRIASVTQDIQAIPASAPIAAALGVTRRSACLRILRRYGDADGKIVEYSISYHPGDSFAYSMHIDVDA